MGLQDSQAIFKLMKLCALNALTVMEEPDACRTPHCPGQYTQHMTGRWCKPNRPQLCAELHAVERYEEWLRSWLSIIPCLTLSDDEPGSAQHVQGEAGPAVATASGDQARGSSAALAVPSQQQPLCRRRAHQESTQEVPGLDT